jgi:predicted GNAT family N-acyltransferase
MEPIAIVRALPGPALETCFAIRKTVFVVEQRVDEAEEYDEYEASSIHYLATIDGEPAGTCRWRTGNPGHVKLERIAVLDHARLKGVGAALVQAMLTDIPHGNTIYMHAQTHALPFYEKLGFVGQGELFWEAGIEHQKMVFSGIQA